MFLGRKARLAPTTVTLLALFTEPQSQDTLSNTLSTLFRSPCTSPLNSGQSRQY